MRLKVRTMFRAWSESRVVKVVCDDAFGHSPCASSVEARPVEARYVPQVVCATKGGSVIARGILLAPSQTASRVVMLSAFARDGTFRSAGARIRCRPRGWPSTRAITALVQPPAGATDPAPVLRDCPTTRRRPRRRDGCRRHGWRTPMRPRRVRTAIGGRRPAAR